MPVTRFGLKQYLSVLRKIGKLAPCFVNQSAVGKSDRESRLSQDGFLFLKIFDPVKRRMTREYTLAFGASFFFV